MDSIENTNPHRSGIRPPSRLPVQLGLQEITESQSNARAQPFAMPPPQQGVKRAFNGTVQPEPKRKTLAERAGEPNPKNIPPPIPPTTSRPTVKGMSIASIASGSSIKPPSTIIGASRHTSTSSTASRQTSTSSFATSIGPGSRPPLSSMGRAPSSMGFNQSVNGRQRVNTRSRPATAMGDRPGDVEQGQQGQQQNGTTNLLPLQTPPRKMRQKKVRGVSSLQSSLFLSQQEKVDVMALDRRFGRLSIQDPDDKPKGAQVNSRKDKQLSIHPPQLDVKLDLATSRPSQHQEAAELTQPGAAISQPPLVWPKTPCRTEHVHQLLSNIEKTLTACKTTPSPFKSASPVKPMFLTRETNLTNFPVFDVDGRLHELDSQFKEMKEVMTVSLTDRKALEDAVELAKTRVSELERDRQRRDDENERLRNELETVRQQFQALTLTSETQLRNHKYELEDKTREHRTELDELRRELKDETDRLQRTHREALEALERHYRVELEDERTQKAREIRDLQTRLGSEQQDLNIALLGKDREIQSMRSQVESLQSDLDREQTIKGGLQHQIAEMSTTNLALEDRNRALRSQIDFLESDSKQQSDSFAAMEARLQDALRVAEEARQKLIKEETERRVLFNKYQELKGNIRVMCRVRPVLDSTEGEEAKIAFPDEKTSSQIDVTGPEERSSFGNVSRKVVPFEFDRVFSPAVHNEEVFDEISQLVQSALDGYNVCIFCYGQTGSGKTHTMSSPDGMIPRATHMIYDTITKLKEKSWSYTMEGSFVEVYNEDLNDLLTPPGEGKRKLEIRHDEARKQTTVLNCRSVALDSPDKVEMMLRQAQNNRSVAATKANERSSRSHSVFILKLVGENAATHERCEGTLNLVDLAGSERLKHSGAEGERMKETQNINKSLACLGDVIEALGRGSGHVPYRNSKLTHLLQFSLGGNSKTLMFVMVSPLEAHLKETLTSLRFATKVHNTHIGTAKSTKKLKERVSDA